MISFNSSISLQKMFKSVVPSAGGLPQRGSSPHSKNPMNAGQHLSAGAINPARMPGTNNVGSMYPGKITILQLTNDE